MHWSIKYDTQVDRIVSPDDVFVLLLKRLTYDTATLREYFNE